MTRHEFQALRALQGKRIDDDVTFRDVSRQRTLWRARDIVIVNTIGWKVIADLHYDARMPKFVVNFSVIGVGPICRLCVNGPEHKAAGRTHKHELHDESDPMQKVRPGEIWRMVCMEANIEHRGAFHDPSA